MLTLVNMVFLAALMLADITLYADRDYPYPATLEEVVAVKLHREFWREDGACWYTGLMVPFTQEPPATTEGVPLSDAVASATGYAIVLNQKTCGEVVESIERLGVAPSSKGGLLKQSFFTAADAKALTPDQRPAWYAQVMSRIERLSASDAKAQAFLARSRAAQP